MTEPAQAAAPVRAAAATKTESVTAFSSVSIGGLSGRAGLGPADFARLQPLTGNRAVTAAIQRDTTAPPATDADPERAKIEKALNNPKPDTSDVKAINDFSKIRTDAERESLIDIMVNHYWGFFGPNDRSTMKKLWESYGAKLPDAVTKNELWWEKCVDLAPDLKNIKLVTDAKEDFRKDIGKRANDNLDANLKYLQGEYDSLGPSTKADPRERMHDDDKAKARALSMAKLADQLAKIQASRHQMLNTVVGFKYVHNPFAPSQEVSYKPMGPKPEGNAKPPTWEDIDVLWQKASGEVNAAVAQYPWLLGPLKDPEQGEKDLAQVGAQTHPLFARAEIRKVMRGQIDKVTKAQENISKVDWFDMDAVWMQLLQGPKWGDPKFLGTFSNWAAKDVLKGRANSEWWKALGLELATDIALVAVTLATAGSAPLLVGLVGAAVAVGTPAAQAMAASAKADQLQPINQATVLPGTDLVTQASVDAERAEASAKAIQAALNALMVGVPLAKAAALELEIVGLGKLPVAQRAEILTKALKEWGPMNTAAKTGMGLEEMLNTVGAETEAGKAVQKQLLEILAKPFGELSAAEKAAIRSASDADSKLTLDSLATRIRLTAKGSAMVQNWKSFADAQSRADWLNEIVNHELLQTGAGDIELVAQDLPETTHGRFFRDKWRIELNSKFLTGNESAEEVVQIIKTAYHEARHAEQYFLMARRFLAKNPKATVAEIQAAARGLRRDIVEKAMKAGALEDAHPQAALADQWLGFFGTPEGDAAYRQVQANLKKATADLAEVTKRYDEAFDVDLLAPKNVRDAVKSEYEKVYAEYEKWFKQYENAPHEVDARRVEGTLGLDAKAEAAATKALDRQNLLHDKLVSRWKTKLEERRAELQKALKNHASDTIVNMRNVDVIEAEAVVKELDALTHRFP